MLATSSNRLPGIWSMSFLGVFALILAVNFLANFWHIADFGVYSDDYFFTIDPAGWSFDEWASRAWHQLTHWPNGRPILFPLRASIAWLCGLTGTLVTFYIVKMLAVTLAATQVVILLRRWVPWAAACMAGLLFVVYPADAAKPQIMHIASHYLALSFTLACAMFYLNRSRWPVLVAAPLLLAWYEPYFLLFFTFPLLRLLDDGRVRWKQWLIYWVILAAIFIAFMLLRKSMGDSRSADLLGNLDIYLMRAVQAPFYGVWTVLKMGVQRPLEVLTHGPTAVFGIFLFATFLIAATCDVFGRRGLTMESSPQAEPGTKLLLGLLLVGLVMMMVPYPYRFKDEYFPPIHNLGRASAMHITGAVGGCMLFATLLAWLRKAPPLLRRITTVAAPIYLGLLVAVGFQIQKESWVTSWVKQKAFWQDLIALTQDAGDGDIIMVNMSTPRGPNPHPTAPGIPFSSVQSSSHKFFDSVFEFPKAWKQPPKVYGVYPGLTVTREVEGGVLMETPVWNEHAWPVVRSGHVIWLEWREGKLIRVNAGIRFNGPVLLTKPQDEPAPRTPNKVHQMLFGIQRTPWPSLEKGVVYPQPNPDR